MNSERFIPDPGKVPVPTPITLDRVENFRKIPYDQSKKNDSTGITLKELANFHCIFCSFVTHK